MKKNSITKEARAVVSSEQVFKGWDYPLFILLTGLSSASILYFMGYWFSFKDWQYYPGTFFVLTFILTVKLSINQFRWFLLLCMRRPRPLAARSGWHVGVATSFVPTAEPLAMLEETVRALVALDYPHDTWVLDEGDDDQVKALCLRLGAHHFSRKNLPHYQQETGLFQSYSKHGNYNAWLHEIGFNRYEIITAFDPDHVPNSAFLSSVLGYFEDPKIGYVQVAQVYYNQKASFIARGAAEETYAFFSATQMASYAMGYPIITGSHNTHRASALKQVGGFAPHDADDLLITLFYRVSGWQGVYVPEILAKGLTPVDWIGYLTQQTRWARSILDIKFRIYPKLARNLPFRERVMSLLHGLSYLQGGVITFVGIILIAFMLATGITPGVVTNQTALNLIALYAILQLCNFYRQRFYLDRRSEWGLHWRAGLLQLAKWPYLLLAIRDVIWDRRVPYTLTHKVRAKSQRYMLLWPHMLVVTVICAAWIMGVVNGRVGHPLLHVLAAITVFGSLLFVLSEHLNFPEPYDAALSHVVGKGDRSFAPNERALALEKMEEKA